MFQNEYVILAWVLGLTIVVAVIAAGVWAFIANNGKNQEDLLDYLNYALGGTMARDHNRRVIRLVEKPRQFTFAYFIKNENNKLVPTFTAELRSPNTHIIPEFQANSEETAEPRDASLTLCPTGETRPFIKLNAFLPAETKVALERKLTHLCKNSQQDLQGLTEIYCLDGVLSVRFTGILIPNQAAVDKIGYAKDFLLLVEKTLSTIGAPRITVGFF